MIDILKEINKLKSENELLRYKVEKLEDLIKEYNLIFNKYINEEI